MNLAKLFAAQKEFREHVGYNGSDRFEKSILGLLVEIGECANEWRGFKYWSQDQLSRTSETCSNCDGRGKFESDSNFPRTFYKEDQYWVCWRCRGTGLSPNKNPLLEEYVDGLALHLELGIEVAEEIMFDVSQYFEGVEREIKHATQKETTITKQFLEVFYLAATIDYDFDFPGIFASYYRLGELLGFTWEEIEQAYFKKIAINHIRQEEGY